MVSTNRVAIQTEGAPTAIGPYSQAIKVGSFIFCSGQIPLDPRTGEVVGNDVGAQTEQILRNVSAILEATGSGLFQVVKSTVYLKSLEDFQAMNTVYEKHFQLAPPARSTVEVSRLPKDVLVEIDCIAYMPSVEKTTTKPF